MLNIRIRKVRTNWRSGHAAGVQWGKSKAPHKIHVHLTSENYNYFVHVKLGTYL